MGGREIGRLYRITMIGSFILVSRAVSTARVCFIVVVLLLWFLPQDCTVMWKITSQQDLFLLKASVFTPLRPHNFHASRPLGNKPRQSTRKSGKEANPQLCLRPYIQKVLKFSKSAFLSMFLHTAGCLNMPLCCLHISVNVEGLCVCLCILCYIYTCELVCVCVCL